MLTQKERIVSKLLALPTSTVQEAYAEWSALASKKSDDIRGELIAAGWVEEDVVDGVMALQDGREVMRAGGRAYVLPIETHRARLEEALRDAKTRAPEPAQKPGEGLSSVLCPACRSVMAKSPICPNCAKGKEGFKILCQCTECAHEVYL